MNKSGNQKHGVLLESIMRPVLVLRDLQSIARGTAVFLKYLVSSDPINIGLGFFGAGSGTARRGTPNKYTVRIASVGEKMQLVKLIIDIYALNVPAHVDGHYAFVAKTLRARPRGATLVEIHYDWQQAADYFSEGTSHSPDVLWRGTYESLQLYVVLAVLLDQQGHELDRLTIYQELVG